jgi:hypothetical protein
MGDSMKILLVLFLSVALAINGKHANYDRQAYHYACRYNGATSGKELLPMIKREFLPYAFVVIGRRQDWHRIRSHWDFVEQVRHNACPTSWDHVSTSKWLEYRFLIASYQHVTRNRKS